MFKISAGIVKTVFVLLTSIFLIIGVVSFNEACCSEGTKMIVLEVEGMTCGACNLALKIALRKLDGVVEVTASYKRGRAEVEYVPEKVTPEQMIAAINKLGKYKASVYSAEGGK